MTALRLLHTPQYAYRSRRADDCARRTNGVCEFAFLTDKKEPVGSILNNYSFNYQGTLSLKVFITDCYYSIFKGGFSLKINISKGIA